MDINEKKKLIKEKTPRSPVIKDCLLAFLFGGAICSFGELLFFIFSSVFSVEEDISSRLVTLSIIALAAILTAVGVFDRIGRAAGAGTLVPVCGFSNAVVSAAMDSSNEGIVFGVGAKIFTVCGPVILFGSSFGIIYGFVLFILSLFI